MEPEVVGPRSNARLAVGVSVLVTALIVGSAVYFYQERKSEVARQELQEQVDDLKAQVAASPSASPVAKASSTPVATATPSSTSALSTFEGTAFSGKIKFEYPSSYGTASLVNSKGEKGDQTRIAFSKNTSLVAGMVNSDYEAGRGAEGFEVRSFNIGPTSSGPSSTCLYSYNSEENTQTAKDCESVGNTQWEAYLGASTYYDQSVLIGFIPSTTSLGPPIFTFFSKAVDTKSKTELKNILISFKFVN